MSSDAPQKWFALEVTAEPAAAEAIEHALNEMSALGTEINHLRRQADDAVTVIGYFHELPEEDFLRDELHHALRIYDLDENAVHFIERNEVPDEDWLHEWKKHWKPTVLGGFVIAPPWEDVDDNARIVIRIEPNMAFGTGTHETTQLCIKAIEENFIAGQSFLDVGTGTGILSIAAAKLSPGSNAKLSGYDTDADSIAIAKKNAELNGVGSMIDLEVGPITETTPVFDLVCANLTIDVILPILPLLIQKTLKILILSGILVEQENMILSALEENHLTNFTIQRQGEWIAAIIQK